MWEIMPSCHEKITFRKFIKKNINNLKKKFDEVQWDKLYLESDAESAYQAFSNLFKDAFNSLSIAPFLDTSLKITYPK